MNKRFFLSNSFFYKLILILILVLIVTDMLNVLMVLVLIAPVLFLFRRKGVKFKDKFNNTHNILHSPLYGQVVSIEKDVKADFYEEKINKIRLNMPLFFEMGIYLPTFSELSDQINKKGKKYFRYSSSPPNENNSKTLLFTTNKDKKFALELTPCLFGARERVWLWPGDQGTPGACIGFLPLGGTVTIYVSQSSKILVKKGQMLVAGQTVIAALK